MAHLQTSDEHDLREARAFQAQLRRTRAAAVEKKDDDDEEDARSLAEFESVEASLNDPLLYQTAAAAAAEDHSDYAGQALVWDGDVGGFFRVSKVQSEGSGGYEIGEMLVRFALGHPLRGGEVHGVALEDVVAYPLPSATDVE